MAEKRKSLGRGLSALLGDAGEDYANLDKVRTTKSVPIEQIHAGKYQPRHVFDDSKIEELAKSIQTNGIIQPLVVRRDPGGQNEYEIIAGERRWRAAQIARLHEVPVIIKDISDQTALEIALVENIQREDLNDIDEAMAYRRLIDEFGHTQDDLARAVGKSRSHIANTLRLLTLPKPVRAMVADGRLSAGHARTLVGNEKAEKLASDIVAKNLTVRDAERLVKKDTTSATAAKQPQRRAADPDTQALEKDIERLLGLPVSLATHGDGGALTIRYKTLEQLDTLLDRLSHGPGAAGGTHSSNRPTTAASPAEAKKKGGVAVAPTAVTQASTEPRTPKADGMPPVPPPPGSQAQRTAPQPERTGPIPQGEKPVQSPENKEKPKLPLATKDNPAKAPSIPEKPTPGALPPVPPPPGTGAAKPQTTSAPPQPQAKPQAQPTPQSQQPAQVPKDPKPVQPIAPANRSADPYAALTIAAAATASGPSNDQVSTTPPEKPKQTPAPVEPTGDSHGWVADTGPATEEDED